MGLLHKILLAVIVCISLNNTNAQNKILGIAVSYGPEVSYGDLAARYGTHLSFGVGTEFFTTSRWGFMLEWRYMFGDNVRTDPYQHLRQGQGSITGVDGLPAEHYYTIAGDQINLQVRKILGKKSSGWVIGASAGLIAYKTVLKDVNRTIAQSFEPYSFYYDQHSRGVSVRQLIGYEFHSATGLINGSVTLENSLAFTKMTRISTKENPLQNDHSIGVRARWIIPLIKGQKKDDIKYF
jgi:hypothetical protein